MELVNQIRSCSAENSRILSLNYEYPPLGGGAGVVSENLDRIYTQKGNAVFTITAGLGENTGLVSSDNHTVYRLRCGRRNHGFSDTREKIGYIITAILYSGKIIREFQPDVIHCHFAVPTGLVAWYLKKRFGLPYVLTSHGGDVPGFTPAETGIYFRLFNRLFTAVWRQASAVTAMSSGLADMIRISYGVPVEVVPNGIMLADNEQNSVSDSDELRLIYAGRFTDQKNLPFLIASLALVQNKNWNLQLVGDGPATPLVRSLIARYGLSDKIQILGWQSQYRVRLLLRESHVLCLPSRNEGLPMIGLEALAEGLALIGTDTVGITDIIDQGVNGYLIPPGDKALFAERIDFLLDNPMRLTVMGHASRKLARKFDWQAIGKDYLGILKSVGNSRGGRRKSGDVLLMNLWPGGPDHYTARLAEIISTRNNCSVLAGDLCDRSLYSANVEYFTFPLAVPHRYQSMGEYLQLLNPLNYLRLFRQVQKLSCRHLIAVHFHPLLMPVFLNRRTSYIYHDPQGHAGEQSRILHMMQRLVLRMAERIFIHSRVLLPGDVNTSLRQKMVLIPHLDYSFFTTKGHSSLKEEKQILFFGRFVPYKGIEYLIRAFRRLQIEFPDWKLVLKGFGPQYFKDDLADINDEQVEVVNRYITDDELADSMRQAGIVVLPYIDGSQSGVLALAAAFEKAVITTGINGLSDQLGGTDTALLISPADTDALGNALRQLIVNADLRIRLGENLSGYYQVYSDPENIISAMDKIEC